MPRAAASCVPSGEPDQHFPCDDVLVAVGQENAFPWIERDCGIQFDEWNMPKVDATTFVSTNPKVYFGGDAAFGPKNIIWAVAHGHEAAVSIDKMLNGEDITDRPLPAVELMSQKMGIHEWSYDNEIELDKRYKVPLRDKTIALKDIKAEVELGFDVEVALKEAGRCLNCDVQTVFSAQLCIECDACVDICPMDCITFTPNGEEAELRTRLTAPVAQSHARPLCAERPQDRPRHGQGRGRLPALRPVRRTLSDRRLGHAEILPGYDSRRDFMPTATPISRVNDFVVRFANVNGSGSASANEMFARAVMRMGVPVAPRNIFPSNIQGLPTWYEVRISEAGHMGARGGTDLMVAMNPQTFDRDIAAIEPGGYLFYNSTKPLPPSKFREDITVIGVPLTAICNREYTDPRQRQLFKNIIYIGALTALLEMDVKVVEQLIGEQYKGKDKLIEPNIKALHIGRDYAILNLQCPLGVRLKKVDKVGDRIFIEGNSAAGASAQSMAARLFAPGIRSRRPRRWPTPLRVTARNCASILKPSRRNTRSSRLKTNFPPSAS